MNPFDCDCGISEECELCAPIEPTCDTEHPAECEACQ